MTEKTSTPIYLDYNGTTPHDPEVIAAMRPPYLDTHFGNPSSLYRYGRNAQAAVEHAREQVAASAGADCHPDRVDISHRLQAMGVPPDIAKGTIRLSPGKMTTEREIQQAIETISEAAT